MNTYIYLNYAPHIGYQTITQSSYGDTLIRCREKQSIFKHKHRNLRAMNSSEITSMTLWSEERMRKTVEWTSCMSIIQTGERNVEISTLQQRVDSWEVGI